jgi:hypothetical protein
VKIKEKLPGKPPAGSGGDFPGKIQRIGLDFPAEIRQSGQARGQQRGHARGVSGKK